MFLALVPMIVSCGGDDGPTPPSPKPDLVIESLVTDPAQPITGQEVTVHATVQNAGTAGAAATRTSVMLDSAMVCTAVSTGALAEGATIEVSCTLGVPDTGTHQVQVCADVFDALEESNEANNCRLGSVTVSNAPPPTQPDLAVNSISFNPPSPQAGASVTATIVVANLGAQVGATLTRVMVDEVTTCESLATPSLDFGATADVSCRFQMPDSGRFVVEACADGAALADESDEANNCLERTLVVTPPLPDLFFRRIYTEPAAPTAADTLDIFVVVGNQGLGPSGESSATIVVGYTVYPGWRFPGFAPGDSTALQMRVRPLAPGSHEVWVGVDGAGYEVGPNVESDETNNQMTFMLVVAPRN